MFFPNPPVREVCISFNILLTQDRDPWHKKRAVRRDKFEKKYTNYDNYILLEETMASTIDT